MILVAKLRKTNKLKQRQKVQKIRLLDFCFVLLPLYTHKHKISSLIRMPKSEFLTSIFVNN